ncbi:tetratricopeptide repeat protein [Striga asiatica]|uniref:Tetratricopeptide repeat protein n=1 Tax=Striga asiatica TaxID=4170 RepID=A0A5A7PLW6_STRAF|nr:tetratricopeptide repeat protein [Striga asiatica]
MSKALTFFNWNKKNMKKVFYGIFEIEGVIFPTKRLMIKLLISGGFWRSEMASASPAMNKIERAHQMYRDGKYRDALNYYTDALYMAKTTPQKIALHSNRAACYLKLHDFNKAAEECTSVLELDYKHTGALMLRAQTLVTLKQYHSALFDVNRLIELNPSSEVYRNLQARLKTQMSLAPIPEDEAECEEDDSYVDETELDNSNEEGEKEDDDEKAKDLAARENGGQNNAVTANNIKNSDFQKVKLPSEESLSRNQMEQGQPNRRASGWQTIPKPKGHSNLDYSRWDRVEDESSEEETDDEDEDDDCRPQYRFRVKTVGVKAVK